MKAAYPPKLLHIVAIGGGTGLATLLSGLKHYVVRPHDGLGGLPEGTAGGVERAAIAELTAVVTVTDDGGSSGRLRRELRILPPGYIRNCMVALSEDEALLSRLFRYRFRAGRGLKGHSFGNLFLAALAHVTRDFNEAVKLSSEVLAIRGRIFPSTTENVTPKARLADGRVVQGETAIARSRGSIAKLSLVPSHCEPLAETLAAIAQADLITVGPGSLYTSLIPNLLVRGVMQAICRARATKLSIANIMTQPGETIGYTTADHIKAIYRYAGSKFFDWVILNSAPASPRLRRKYRRQGADQVVNDFEEIRRLGVRYVSGELLMRGDVARHDPERLARLVLSLAF